MAKVLILEDEEYNQIFIKQMLSEIPGITQIYATSNAKDAVAWTKENHPHIALLDIELSEQTENGLTVAKQIRKAIPDIYIVFVTGHSHYAVDSFDVHPYGYVLKPIKVVRFQELVGEIVSRLKLMDKKLSNVLTVRVRDEIIHINSEEIIFIEVENHKSIIHSLRTTWEIRKGLDEIAGMLGTDFLRVHRSFIVNMTKIKKAKEVYDRSYEIEFWDYPKTALMSRYYFPKYQEHFQN